MHLRRADDEVCLIPGNQIPRVSGELMFNTIYETGWTEEVEAPLSAQTDQQKTVESREMVHVSM